MAIEFHRFLPAACYTSARTMALGIQRSSGWRARLALVWLLLFVGGCPNGVRVALDLINEARRLTGDAIGQLDRAAEASNRAVMVPNAEAAQAAGKEAERARKLLVHDLDQIEALLHELNYTEELTLLRQVRDSLAAYEAQEVSILALAREKSNRKALELAFGETAHAADAYRQLLNQLSAAAKGKTAPAVQLQCASAALSMRELQLLEAPHILEPEDALMEQLEQRMQGPLQETRKAMTLLATNPAPEARPLIDPANTALEHFLELHAQLLELSRRNSDMRALALSLEQKRSVQVHCQDALAELSEALSQRAHPATR
jgi:hypothetical protein